jgi:cytochrome c-type biogenesis protein CcmH
VFDLAKLAGPARLFTAIAAVAIGASLLAFLLVLALHLYSDRPTAPGAESETRPAAATEVDSRADAIALARRLNAHLEQQPGDTRAWAILARLEFELNHFAEAARAYEKALAQPSKVANDPALWCEYADALGMLQDGKLAGKPRELIDHALALNPNHPKALEMAGSAEYAQGSYAAALHYWRPLLAQLAPGSQAHAELAAAIARAERFARTALPAPRQ